MWIWFGLISMLFLGFYDICKKHSLKDNSVLCTLFISNLVSFLIVLPILLASSFMPDLMQRTGFYVEPMPFIWHVYLIIKAVIVGSSWIFAYFALKHLPISIASPIRATAPMWTLIAAVLFFHERPEPLQWVGIVVVFACYLMYAMIGHEEGIKFHKSKWVAYLFVGTLIGAGSALYDKWLIQIEGFAPMQVLGWYFLYIFFFFILVALFFWWPRRHALTPFRWVWTIPLIGILLVIADLTYFMAISHEEALIVMLSILRRSSVLVSFFIGAILFKEVNKRKKAYVLMGILAGVCLIVYSS